jgi:tetratricopeptide (TPR) repeat protein
MENFELYNKIEAYLKGEISAEAAQAFELEVSQNPELAEQVALHRLEYDAMEVLIEKDLRSQMTEWQQTKTAVLTPSVVAAPQTQMTAQRGGQFRFYAWAAAASLTLLAVAAIWYFNRPEQPPMDMTDNTPPTTTPQVNPDSLDDGMLFGGGLPADTPNTEGGVQQPQKPNLPNKNQAPMDFNRDKTAVLAVVEQTYYEGDVQNYEDMTAMRGVTIAANLEEAGKAYDKKDYATAINLLKNTPVSAENFMALEILAHAYFQSKNYTAAQPVFENLLKLSGRRSKEKSEWLLLLTYLANGKTSDFDGLSRTILENKEHVYNQSAGQLVQKLGRK